MRNKCLIVAYSSNKVIGKDNKMPWKLQNELDHFKKITTNNIIIMGRKTFESIGKALPNRINIVISKSKKYGEENLYTVCSLDEAFNLADSMAKDKKIFVIGGSSIFEWAIDIVDFMYITVVERDFYGDRFFPYFDYDDFILREKKCIKDEIPCTFYLYERKKK